MTGAGGSTQRRGRSPRRPTTFLGVLGELLVTAGVVTLLFVAWQLWIGDVIIGSQRYAAAEELSEEWAASYDPEAVLSASASPDPVETTPAEPVTADPVILPEAPDAEIFGLMRIPRFGSDYAVNMAGGVSRPRTLDPIGIGHYPGTPMPGDVGNVALAAHRTTFGKPFNQIANLRLGDAVVIETPDGWYTYRFRTLEYVTPDAIDVLLPVPQVEGAAANGRYLTLTSCSPMFSKAERIIAYTVFDSFTPRSAGPPASLAAVA